MLVDLYDRGMREPLPLYCQTSAAYAEAARAGQDAGRRPREEWTSESELRPRGRELEHQLVLGGVRTFDELLETRPAPTSAATAGTSEATRFGR